MLPGFGDNSGKNIALGSIVLLFTIGLISRVVPNIPLVIAMVPLLKEYLVNTGLAGADILVPNSMTPIPTAVLPLFYAMMYGATLGAICQDCFSVKRLYELLFQFSRIGQNLR